MKKLLALFAGVAAVTLVATAAEEDKPKSVKEVMKKAHGGTNPIVARLKAQVKEGKWEDAAQGAKTLKLFGEALADLTPPKGSPESWTKNAALYKTNTAAVAEAVTAKDLKATDAAVGKIGASCKGCHKDHKGK